MSARQYIDVKIKSVPITADAFNAKINGFRSHLAELNTKGAKLDQEIADNLNRHSFVETQ